MVREYKNEYQERISKRIREKERGRIRRLITPTTILLIFFIFIFFSINTPNFNKILDQRREIKAFQNVLEQVKRANQELKKKVEIISSDEYIEEEARRKFGLVKENQTAYIVVDEADEIEELEIEQEKYGISYQFWENFAKSYWSLRK
ncbi:MAG: septum formation initiator family protein [Actinomycetia bacterium]|nr:septum formation initiator family protein [Actinomycetes bacterium]